jgi:DNA/RNA-binding domain of Phe-tRNA-synthetase-like protein
LIHIEVAAHPLLRVGAFVTEFPVPLVESPSPDSVVSLLKLDAAAPFQSDDALRAAVRDLLRHGGYKPTGRGKPASEYLLRAAGDGSLGPINLAVDACNAVSLHSGFPISVVDLDLAQPPYRIAIAAPGESYVFNSANQEIDLTGLLCLYDAKGPCANAVKDSQRTKTHASTRKTLSVVWGCASYAQRVSEVAEWYRRLLQEAGGSTEVAEERQPN